MEALTARLLEPHSIPLPRVEMTIELPHYRLGSSIIFLNGCTPVDVVAHELGHYVMDRAHGYLWSAHTQDALDVFCPGPVDGARCTGGWIKGKEITPGVEHAAHCVGNVLAGYGTYTKCPDAALYAEAAERVRRAIG